VVFGKETRHFPWETSNLQLVTIEKSGYSEPAVLHGDEVIGIKSAGFPDMLSEVAGGADAMYASTDFGVTTGHRSVVTYDALERPGAAVQ